MKHVEEPSDALPCPSTLGRGVGLRGAHSKARPTSRAYRAEGGIRLNAARIIAFLALAAILSGCAHRAKQASLTPRQWTDPQSALQTLAERAKAVKTVQSEASITISRPDTGDTVRLDGALALQPPDNARLRAWKLGQAIFDLTINPQGAWAVLPQDKKDQMLPAGKNASQFLRQWSTYLGDFFAEEGLTFDDRKGAERFTVSRKMGDGTLTCEVERSTLTPRVYRFDDEDGKTRFTLALDGYEEINGQPFPTQMVAKGDGVGQVRVELIDAEINGEIAPKAFVAPRKAEKLP